MPPHYRFRYTGIRVRDLDASVWFYREALGMELVWRGPVESTSGEVALLRTPGTSHQLELSHYPSGSGLPPPYREGDELDHLAFGVEDVFRAVDELRGRGVRVRVDPPGTGGIVRAFVLDPDGIWVELVADPATPAT